MLWRLTQNFFIRRYIMNNMFNAKLLTAAAVIGLSMASVPAGAVALNDFIVDEAV